MTKQQLRTTATITARAMQQRSNTYIHTYINMRWYIFALTNRMNMNVYPYFYWFNAADARCSYDKFFPNPPCSPQKVRHRSQRTYCDNLYENDVHMYVCTSHTYNNMSICIVYICKYICTYLNVQCRTQFSSKLRLCACVSWRQLQICVGVGVCSCNWTVKLLSADVTLLENCQQLCLTLTVCV